MIQSLALVSTRHGSRKEGVLTFTFLVITALNFTSLAANGPLPTDHIPKDQVSQKSEALRASHTYGSVF